MIRIGLDLSINSTGVCVRKGDEKKYFLIVPKLSKKMVAVNEMKSCDISHITYDKIKDNVGINIRRIGEKIVEIIKVYEGNIECVVIEDVALAARGRSIIDLTLLNGYVRCLLDQMGIEYISVPPTQWKKVLLGNGQADKELIIYHWMKFDYKNYKHMFDMNCKMDDAADSYFLSCFENKGV